MGSVREPGSRTHPQVTPIEGAQPQAPFCCLFLRRSRKKRQQKECFRGFATPNAPLCKAVNRLASCAWCAGTRFPHTPTGAPVAALVQWVSPWNGVSMFRLRQNIDAPRLLHQGKPGEALLLQEISLLERWKRSLYSTKKTFPSLCCLHLFYLACYRDL